MFVENPSPRMCVEQFRPSVRRANPGRHPVWLTFVADSRSLAFGYFSPEHSVVSGACGVRLQFVTIDKLQEQSKSRKDVTAAEVSRDLAAACNHRPSKTGTNLDIILCDKMKCSEGPIQSERDEHHLQENEESTAQLTATGPILPRGQHRGHARKDCAAPLEG